MKETILSTKQIYNGIIVDLAIHEVELPNGQTATRELIRHPGAVAIVALDADENVLLIRQYRLGSGAVMVELPAGKLEGDEPLEDSANRELREETGYRAQSLHRIGGWHVAPGYTTEYIHLFIARDLVHDPLDGDDDEFIEVTRVPFQQAIDMVRRGEISNSTGVAGILLAAQFIAQDNLSTR